MSFKMLFLSSLFLSSTVSVWADDSRLLSADPASQGVLMMNWQDATHSENIVAQLQTIHRYCQDNSPEAISGLVEALDSSSALVRRKAARSLLERVTTFSLEEKKALLPQLQRALRSPDVILQKNIVRCIAEIHTPQAQQELRAFFKASAKETQLSAVNALSQDAQANPEALKIASQASPYSEVRQAAQENLH